MNNNYIMITAMNGNEIPITEHDKTLVGEGMVTVALWIVLEALSYSSSRRKSSNNGSSTNKLAVEVAVTIANTVVVAVIMMIMKK